MSDDIGLPSRLAATRQEMRMRPCAIVMRIVEEGGVLPTQRRCRGLTEIQSHFASNSI